MKRKDLKVGVDYLLAERAAWADHSREASRVRVLSLDAVERQYSSSQRGAIIPGKGSGVHVLRLNHDGSPRSEAIVQLQTFRGEWVTTWPEVQAYADERQRVAEADRDARRAAEKAAVAMVERAEAAGFGSVHFGTWQQPDRILLTTAQLGALLDTIEHLKMNAIDH